MQMSQGRAQKDSDLQSLSEHDTGEEPPAGCSGGIAHYHSISEVPQYIQKYYHQRHDIFSQYDRGIWMGDDSWFGVTPEPIAEAIANDIAATVPETVTTIIDVFAGVGGNTIAFAKSGRWSKVIGIERNPSLVTCAKHNAGLYEVGDTIEWLEADCWRCLKCLPEQDPETVIIFASPPWGGPDYSSQERYDLDQMQPYNLESIVSQCSLRASRIVLYLPRSSDIRQLAKYGTTEKPVDIVHYCLRGASKALCAYLGDFTSSGYYDEES